MGFTFEDVLAALLAVLVVSEVVGHLSRRVGFGFGSFTFLTQFITPEDLEIAQSEEEAEKAKLALQSGKKSIQTVSDGEEFLVSTEATPLLKHHSPVNRPSRHTWCTISLGLLGLVEAVGRAVLLVLAVVATNRGQECRDDLPHSVVYFAAWVYATLAPMYRPPSTVSYKLLGVHTISLLSTLGVLYPIVLNNKWPSTTSTLLHGTNAIITVLGIAILSSLPLEDHGEPSVDDEGLLPARDDYVTLYQWVTFNWVSDYVRLAAKRTLEESDVWQLSRPLRTRVLMTKFRNLKQKTLLGRLGAANALDLIVDFGLTLVSSFVQVAQPYLLNLTLRALERGAVSSTLPLHSMAIALPAAYYDIPLRAAESVAQTLHVPPSLVMFSSSSGDDAKRMAYFYASLSFILQIVKSLAGMQSLYNARRAAVRTQNELIGCIYEKTLVRKDITGAVAASTAKKGKDDNEKVEAVESADVGKIVSLISTDAKQISGAITSLHRLYELPIFTLGTCYLLYSLMGWTAFLGFVTFAATTPFNWWIMSKTYKVRKTLLDVRDLRMREMNQVIQSIKFIKFFAWEKKWVERVMDARTREMTWLRKSKWLRFAVMFLWDGIPLFVSIISFTSFVLIAKRELTVAIAFPALQALGLLSRTLTMYPIMSNYFIQVYASVKRIGKYLEEDEIPEWVSWKSESRLGNVGPAGAFDDRVGFSKASFIWSFQKKDESEVKKDATETETPAEAEPQPFGLRDLDIFFELGRINLISGPTGSGKSSLLSALLGEMNCTSGTVHLPKNSLHVDPETGLRNDVSYCSQHPWLQHQSIRDNILFGLVYDKPRLQEVLRVCQLNPDLALLKDGDLTEIGEKGVSLSGGQKARVALARAVYSRSKTVILDDILSAVDSHTAEKLISECLLGPLMAHRTVIIVTHHVDLIVDHCAWVALLDSGSIAAQGTPGDLRKRGLLSALIERAKQSEEVAPTSAATDEGDAAESSGDGTSSAPDTLVKKEEKAEGSVKLRVYHIYFKASSYFMVLSVVLLIMLQYAGEACQKFWIRFWGESYLANGDSPLGFPRPQDNVAPYLATYVGIEFLTAGFTVIREVPQIYASLRASRGLYLAMLSSVVRAPSRWFDQTPSGRILNRFSSDVDTLDGGLDSTVQFPIAMGVACLTTIVVVLSVTPLFVFPLIAIIAFQAWTSRGYIDISRDLQRIESNSRSPIVTSFSELIAGISTVRAFGTERFFVDKLYKRLDRVQAASFYYWTCNRWMMYRLNLLGAFVVLSATLIAIASGVSPGLAGVVIASASVFVMDVYYMMQGYTDMEQSMNSIERIQEYMDVPSEPPAIIESNRPPAYWPSNSGDVVVENLVLRYAPELDPVLRGLTFTIKPTEKIGLVGRTGSGKSTLALAFFRFVDADEGKIIIDGIGIAEIGLYDLRSKLTIIPQDAVLFTGTIRDNLDPFGDYSDEDCLRALRSVQLRVAATVTPTEAASQTPVGTDSASSSSLTVTATGEDDAGKQVITLESPVSEGGNNFSSGQRQLIALARALLRKSRFVVMDESTASVDFATDLKIQEVIREEFKDSILITIAHRLRTVIDYDRIIVMDTGQIVEFDTPENLINKTDGVFREMCVKTGSFEELRAAATKSSAW